MLRCSIINRATGSAWSCRVTIGHRVPTNTWARPLMTVRKDIWPITCRFIILALSVVFKHGILLIALLLLYTQNGWLDASVATKVWNVLAHNAKFGNIAGNLMVLKFDWKAFCKRFFDMDSHNANRIKQRIRKKNTATLHSLRIPPFCDV